MGGESIRPHLKMQNLFVRDISKGASPSVVRATLEKAAGPLCKVVIPLDFKTDQSTHIGQAYLNFASQAEAECCLEKIRFKLVFAKQRAKVLYAPGNSQSDKDKNLSEEVEVEAFYDFFSKFGEILQCKTDTDNYGQYFGQVQYMETSSVASAVECANGTRWHGAVIQVVPHHKAAQVESAPTPRPKVDVSSPSNFPALGAPSSSTSAPAPTPAAATPTPTPGRAAVSSRQLPAPALAGAAMAGAAAAPPPAAAAERSPPPVNFAVQALERSGGSGNSFGTDSPGSRPLAAFSGSGSNLHVGAPVVAPLALPITAPVAAPVVAPLVATTMAEVVRPTPSDFSAATTGPGARPGPTAAAAAGGMGRLSLLDRIMLNRAEAAAGGTAAAAAASAGAAVAAPAGPEVLHMAQPGTPNANGVIGSGRVNGHRKKGGLIKSLVQTLDQVSELLCCPITHEVLRDPVVAADGITYERRAIAEWLASHNTSPMTNIPLANLELHPNNLVRTLIEELM